ncbi:serine hydrolase domain-containing protein [Peribacillus sp. NPDC097225]|uniref:serine hydrolase domain-containing protein n=1 Tax=Peribacillus sp. NPDC097225 TaxID=3364400 RepID=UPI003803E4F3
MRKRHKIISFILTILLVLTSVSGVVLGNEQASRKLDSSAIDEFMANEIERLKIQGASLAIVEGDRVEYVQGYGVANQNGTEMTSETPIVLGSVSKSFTALALMQLVDQGKIRLQDPVQLYIPWFHLADKEASGKITIQHLLNHTSGLSTYDGQVAISQGDKTLKEHVKGLAEIELKHPAGDRYEYSNLNYDILGLVIEEVTNLSYKDYLNEFIFKPLEMKNTYGDPKDVANHAIAGGYQTVFGWKLPTKQLKHEGSVPSGYIISSAEDMANYMIAQLNHGTFNGKGILSKNGMNTLHQPSSYIGDDTYYAMGWEVKDDEVSHNGWTENTYSKVILDGQYGISLQINSMDYFNLNEYDSIISGVNKLVHHEEPPSPTDHPFMKYAVIDLIILGFVTLIVWSIYRIFKPKPREVHGFLRILHMMFLVMVYWLIPLSILINFPYLFGPLSTVTLFAPGIGHLLFGLPLLLLMVGVVTLGKGIRTARKTHLNA